MEGQEFRVSILERIELIYKTGLAITIGCYIIGLLILNIYLAQFGIFNLGFLQVKYVMVGALWVFLNSLTYVCYLWVYHSLKENFELIKENKKTPRVIIIQTILFIFLLVSIWNSILNTLTDSEISILDISSIKLTSIVSGILISNFISLWAIHNLIQKILKISSTKKESKEDLFYNYVNIYFYFVMFLGSLSLYALYVFPKFPQTFGGGKSQKIEFVIKSEHEDVFVNFGFQPEKKKIGPINLIFEINDFYLIEPPSLIEKDFITEEKHFRNKLRAIQLKKELIESSLYWK